MAKKAVKKKAPSFIQDAPADKVHWAVAAWNERQKQSQLTERKKK